jgi:Leucine-rich repeat (LRR) protein
MSSSGEIEKGDTPAPLESDAEASVEPTIFSMTPDMLLQQGSGAATGSSDLLPPPSPVERTSIELTTEDVKKALAGINQENEEGDANGLGLREQQVADSSCPASPAEEVDEAKKKKRMKKPKPPEEQPGSTETAPAESTRTKQPGAKGDLKRRKTPRPVNGEQQPFSGAARSDPTTKVTRKEEKTSEEILKRRKKKPRPIESQQPSSETAPGTAAAENGLADATTKERKVGDDTKPRRRKPRPTGEGQDRAGPGGVRSAPINSSGAGKENRVRKKKPRPTHDGQQSSSPIDSSNPPLMNKSVRPAASAQRKGQKKWRTKSLVSKPAAEQERSAPLEAIPEYPPPSLEEIKRIMGIKDTDINDNKTKKKKKKKKAKKEKAEATDESATTNLSSTAVSNAPSEGQIPGAYAVPQSSEAETPLPALSSLPPPPTMEETKELFRIQDGGSASTSLNKVDPTSGGNSGTSSDKQDGPLQDNVEKESDAIALSITLTTPSSEANALAAAGSPPVVGAGPNPENVPPKPFLETEQESQSLVNMNQKNTSASPAASSKNAKRTKGNATAETPSLIARDAPPDLLSEPLPSNTLGQEQHPANAIEEQPVDPIQDPGILVVQYENDKLRKRKFQLKKLYILGTCFLVAVGIVSVIFHFVIGWDEEQDDETIYHETGEVFSIEGLPDDTLAALENLNSPQSRAYQWLSRDPNRYSYPDWRLRQRFAVAVMIFSLRQATGPSAISAMFSGGHWLVYEKSECDWGSMSDTLDNSPVCDDKDRYINLDLSSVSGVDADLITTVPAEVSFLSELKSLGMVRNGIFIPWEEFLPSNIGQLENLRILDFSHNEITNQITKASALFRLADLESLDLSWNHLTGEIPAELASLRQLTRLNLAHNRLSGSIEKLVELKNLESLELGGNELAGKMPSLLGSLSKLQSLFLAETSLTGEIPTELGMLSNTLAALDLGTTLLTGAIPTELGLLGRTLKYLDLSANSFSGRIPSELGLLSSLEWLSLSLSSLTGSAPSELGQLKALKELDISNSLLNGPLPTEIGTLTTLQRLHMFGNSHTGSIISEIGSLGGSLLWLDLSVNKLSGVIPSELGLLSILLELDLSTNSLTGSIPMELFRISTLQRIDLTNNFLTERLPENIGEGLTSVNVLRLGGNYLEGSIPSTIGLLGSLLELDLSNTAITGSVPSELALLTDLQILKLSKNFLSGGIPVEMESLTTLRIIELEGTGLTGGMPEGLCLLPYLESLSVDCSKVNCGDCRCECK